MTRGTISKGHNGAFYVKLPCLQSRGPFLPSPSALVPGPMRNGSEGCPGCPQQLPGRLRASSFSPESLLWQEVWKPSLKLQEKFGKISCNYPNDSCTNHTTTPQIPCHQAEPKAGRAKTHIWIQGDLWKLSLQRAWAGRGMRGTKAELAMPAREGTILGEPPSHPRHKHIPRRPSPRRSYCLPHLCLPLLPRPEPSRIL